MYKGQRSKKHYFHVFSIFSVLLFGFLMQNNKIKGFLKAHEFGCFVFMTPAQITFCEGAE